MAEYVRMLEPSTRVPVMDTRALWCHGDRFYVIESQHEEFVGSKSFVLPATPDGEITGEAISGPHPTRQAALEALRSLPARGETP